MICTAGCIQAALDLISSVCSGLKPWSRHREDAKLACPCNRLHCFTYQVCVDGTYTFYLFWGYAGWRDSTKPGGGKVWKYGTYACMAAHIMVFTDRTMGLQTHGCTLRPPLKVFCEKDMRRSSKVYTFVPGVKGNDYMYCINAWRKKWVSQCK